MVCILLAGRGDWVSVRRGGALCARRMGSSPQVWLSVEETEGRAWPSAEYSSWAFREGAGCRCRSAGAFE